MSTRVRHHKALLQQVNGLKTGRVTSVCKNIHGKQLLVKTLAVKRSISRFPPTAVDQNTTTLSFLGCAFFTGTCTSSWSALILLDSRPRVIELAAKKKFELNVSVFSLTWTTEIFRTEMRLTWALVFRTIFLKVFHWATNPTATAYRNKTPHMLKNDSEILYS